MINYICSKCNKIEPLSSNKFRCDCGGLFNLDYKANFSISRIKNDWSLFRYRNFFPLNNAIWTDITLGEGMTPIVKLEDNVLIKIEYAMPTLSFKDRGAALLIWLCKTLNIKKVIQDSSGNAGNSIAAYATKANIECEIFVPESTSKNKINMIKSHGAKVTLVPGGRDKTAEKAREKVLANNVFYASHVYNPFFYQGTKTYIYEVYEQLSYIPTLFIPLGNGTLFFGIILALEELIEANLIDRMPKIYCVQSENCAPIYKSYKNNHNKPSKIKIKPTLAEGIAIGEPMRGESILSYIYKYNIEVLIAEEKHINTSKNLLAKKGYYVEATTAATYAAYLEKKNEIKDEVLIPLCGSGLKSE